MPRNHYVPQFYLRYFSNNGKSVGLYNLETHKYVPHASIAEQACVKDLYGKDPTLESWFCKKERTWAKIIKEIIQKETIPQDPKDYLELLNFILLADARTKKMADSQNELIDNLAKITIEMQRYHKVHNLTTEGMRITWDIPNYYPIITACEMVQILLDLQMILIINNSNKSFITTDNPVVKYNQMFVKRRYFRNAGYGHMGTQIFVPLSPRYCICVYDPIIYDVDVNKNKTIDIKSTSQITEINKLSLLNADKVIFFNNNEKESHIKSLVKNYKKKQDSTIGIFGDIDNRLMIQSFPTVQENIRLNFFSINKEFENMPLPLHMEGPIRPYVQDLLENDLDSIEKE
jgi:hypothetical protein